MPFREVAGQKEIVEKLRRMQQGGNLGHAYVFCGPKGIGKKLIAECFAQLLLCEQPIEGDMCGICKSCQLYENGATPDFLRINGTGTKGIGVDKIRAMLSFTATRPFYSKKKLCIIEEADTMTAQAQNCLLKTLEEPPPYVVILLTTSNYGSLLETIRSRTVRIDFRSNSYEEVLGEIIKRCGKKTEALEFAAAWSEGSIGRALEIFCDEDFKRLRADVFEVFQKLAREGLPAVFKAVDFFEKNKDNYDILLDLTLGIYRDMLTAIVTGDENLLINKDKKDIIFSNAMEHTAERLADIISHIGETRRSIEQNANYLLAAENLLLRITEEHSRW